MRKGLSVLLCCGALLCTSQAVPRSAGGIEAVSRPSHDVTLSFVRPGIVEETAVRDGDRVEQGQLLVRQDTSAEEARLEGLRIQAENTTSIRAAEARLAQRRVDLEELEQAAEKGAASRLEVDQARLDVTIAELSVELAKLQQKQYQSQYDQQRLLIERMRLESPVDGTVEQVLIEEGESVDALEEVVRVVDVDPLWIDAPVPLPRTAGVKPGDEVTVEFTGPGGQHRTGKVLHVGSVADAASATLRVRIEVDNPTGRPAGETVFVHLGASE
jgi:RND family efflux transporter MFP subunit